MTSRTLIGVAICSAVAGALLLMSDAVVHDWALAFGSLGLLAASAVGGILVVPAANGQSDDVWARFAWGRFFVAIVYASIAVACFLVMAHTPDATKFVHALRAALQGAVSS
jgi:hypothetical protein